MRIRRRPRRFRSRMYGSYRSLRGAFRRKRRQYGNMGIISKIAGPSTGRMVSKVARGSAFMAAGFGAHRLLSEYITPGTWSDWAARGMLAMGGITFPLTMTIVNALLPAISPSVNISRDTVSVPVNRVTGQVLSDVNKSTSPAGS